MLQTWNCDHTGPSSRFSCESRLGLVSKKYDVSVILWCHLFKLWSKKQPVMPVMYNFLSNSFGLLSRLFLNVCVFPSRPWKQMAEQWALLRCDSAILSSFFLVFLIYQLLSPTKRTNSSWSVYAIITNLTKRFECALSERKMYFYHFPLLPRAIIQKESNIPTQKCHSFLYL